MKKFIFMIFVCMGFVFSCADLDMFIEPVIFIPERLDAYKLENSTDVKIEFSEYNQVTPDNTIDNFGSIEVSFAGNAGTLFGHHLVRSGAPTGKTILYFHGNMKNNDIYWPRAKILYDTGYNVFMLDYRGHGKSEGTITEAGMLEDAESALDFLVNTKSVPKSNILVYGYSLGSVPAVHIAANYNMDSSIGLVLEAPMGSMELYVQDATFLSIPGTFISQYTMDNVTNIKKVNCRLLWIHGKSDATNRWDTHGLAVYNHHPGVTYQLLLDNGYHSDLPELIGFTEYYMIIKNFMDATGDYTP